MKRRYLITFMFNTKYSLRYTVMIGTSKDDVYGSACAMHGFLNVAGVYVDNPDNSFTTIPMRVPKKSYTNG